MKKIALLAAACGVLAASAAVKVDFAQAVGPVRPMHGAGQPPQIGYDYKLFRYLKEAGIPYSRLHDVGGAYGKNIYVDIPNLFRDFDADENDPKSYDFAFTDHLLKELVANGVEPYFRLGITIENRADIRAYRTFPPKDPEKWARICEHVVRHYTEGWANGYHWGDKMRYWELWNEPNDMPGGSWIIKSGDKDQGKNNYTFNSFYIYVLKYLKAEFPHLKFGGPAVCYFDRSFLRALLDRCAKEGYTPDFISWHSYGDNPRRMLSQPAEARKMLDEYGFKDTELVINEWHWFHDN
jgi:hypothetical protein